MDHPEQIVTQKASIQYLPRNVWAVGVTSFLMDISSEMVIYILPLFLANVLGVQTSIIGLIEGIAEATASMLKLFSGWLSDKLGGRKWLAVAGYGSVRDHKTVFLTLPIAGEWLPACAGWTGWARASAPRHGMRWWPIRLPRRRVAWLLAFTGRWTLPGRCLGIIDRSLVVWLAQENAVFLAEIHLSKSFVISLLPAFLAVLSLALGARMSRSKASARRQNLRFASLGKPFIVFLGIVSIFTLGNSSDAFLVLRAQNLGVSVTGILLMLAMFNLIYSLISTPAGSLSDRIGRKRLIMGGWLVYAAIYLGFALAQTAWHVWLLYAVYGLYYGLAYGTANALVADLVPENLRGTAYGTTTP